MDKLRDIQLCELSILKEVVSVCDKHNLTYYLSSGTLLGAVRHKGFIPWDDDIDIEMPVEDYKKFLKFAQNELPDNLFLQTYYTDPGYNEMWAKVRANGTTSMPIEWKGINIHWGICIDIFPLVGESKDNKPYQLQKKALGLCRLLLAKDFTMVTNPKEICGNYKLKLLYLLPRSLRIAICRVLEHFVFLPTSDADTISILYTSVLPGVKRSAFREKILLPFEDSEFYVPVDYDYILTKEYGDYMTPPPEIERNGHAGQLGSIIYECHKDYSEFK